MSRKKKGRVFSRETKLKAVQRMIAGESVKILANELRVRRKSLYEWKDHFLAGGAECVRSVGRPRKDQVVGPPPEPSTQRAELLQARQRIAELERKVGKQQLEIDFFAEALRRVDTALKADSERNAQRSTRWSQSKPRKAD